MENITVVISTYNGENHIIRQLESIFRQVNVTVSVYIRDDNSSDNTIKVIEEYKRKHPDYIIRVMKGDNLGYAKSFWTALKNCGEADYYAFSDQDDVWKPDKLYKCIKAMKSDEDNRPKLSYCKMIRSDEKLNQLAEQVKLVPLSQITKKIALTKTYNYGAATVINKSAKELICRVWPNVNDLPHDLWAGLLCFWFGKVYYIDEALYYWIRYSTSVTGEGTKNTGRIYRLKRTFCGKSYVNVAQYLIEYYSDLMNEDDKKFLTRILNYKHSIDDRVCLLFDRSFNRDSFVGTVVLKIGILFGWY